jgi:hypothetical protein
MCGGSTINVSGQATYDKLVAGLGNGGCPCPADLPPSCVGGQCTICTGQPTDPAGCNGDAGQCVTVNPASYDESCQSDSDCVAAQVGTICPGSCECGNASVSQAAAAAIQQATQGIATLGCPCPPPDFASKCVGGTCTACTLGGGAAGCPDGG